MTLYVRECFDCLELCGNDDKVTGSWVRIKGKAGKADILAGVCSRPPNQDEEADELFFKVLADISCCQPLFLWEPLTCWMSAGNNMVEKRQSERFLECVEENFRHSR